LPRSYTCTSPSRRRLRPVLRPARQPAGLAADEPRYNQVSLRAEVSKEVARDLMIVTLYSEAQNSDPAKLAADHRNHEQGRAAGP
jgi:predicted secreted protein